VENIPVWLIDKHRSDHIHIHVHFLGWILLHLNRLANVAAAFSFKFRDLPLFPEVVSAVEPVPLGCVPSYGESSAVKLVCLVLISHMIDAFVKKCN
jgi:hypothetical protein